MNYHVHRHAIASRQRQDLGYILLVLLLFVAVLSIGFLRIVQKIDFQIKRDREEELIHRGVQYSRAVRHFFKKFGRYPTRIEDLENTNNIRFLRKRYKDPITGKDFKLLHLTDLPQMAAMSPNLRNAAVTGLNGMQSSFRAGGGGTFAAGGGGSFGPGNASTFSTQQPGAPGALNSTATASASPGPSAITVSDNTQAGGPSDASAASQTSGSGPSPLPQPLSQQLGANGTPQVFGGGAIIGVASLSKEQTIREFNKKNHYNEWQFVYDPTMDRGGLLMTPNQPPLQGAVPASQMQSQSNKGQSGFPAVNQGFGTPPTSQPPNSQAPPQQ